MVRTISAMALAITLLAATALAAVAARSAVR
jgi:hypothetical protein